ncbi:MAG: protein-L-isoaspartate(D-aspartate) O-methyltransferase [Synergistetes bacterium]|nr:protein-L-isoaspartate(D-aspartate) O-methyltransferase [Synergistota bacterium]MDW8191742.1 protein-L-isoaspartate(D-aspartate) O-methyltransferase [Synergistota bacterium]
MIKEQIEARGLKDEKILNVMRKVPRHLFVPQAYLSESYDDHPLPIGEGQTISQPYMVALMTSLLDLKGDERVLEIGTGSGYQTAILAELAKEVFSIERIESLAKSAEERLKALGYKNVRIKVGDGSLGWEEYAPYDAIIVTAAAPKVPSPLTKQLKVGGRIVIPIGDRFFQNLHRYVKKGEETLEGHDFGGCVFVPLRGKEGWD